MGRDRQPACVTCPCNSAVRLQPAPASDLPSSRSTAGFGLSRCPTQPTTPFQGPKTQQDPSHSPPNNYLPLPQPPGTMTQNESSSKLSLVSNPIRLINQTLSGCVERTASSSRYLRQLLKLHQEKLRNCHDPYPRQSSKSRSAIQAGKVTLHDGELVTLSDQRKENVIRISETFDIDEVDALVLWLQFLHAEPPASSDPSSADQSNSKKVTDIGFQEEKCDDGVLAKFSSFYFEERRSALIVVASTLLIAENESSAINETCSELLDQIISVETPSSMLESFTKRTSSSLPDSVRATARQALIWTQQLMYEQKLILEVIFLLFYGRIKPDAAHYVSVLKVLRETSWGKNQACLPYFDEETSMINLNVSNLLTLIALQASHTEDICSPEFSLAPEPTERELTHPAKLKEIYDLQLNLLEQQPQQAAPIALAWSFILHQLTNFYLENEIPHSHQDFAELILPQSNQINSDQDDELNTEQQEETMPLYQRWARHVLSNQCQLFQNLSQLATSVYCASSHNRFGASDNNALGYLVTIRTFLSAVPIFFRLSYLGSQQFEEAINVFGLLFRLDVQHAIASDLWRAVDGDLDVVELPLATGEAEYLAAARVRFPINVGLFTGLCRSLSGFNETMQPSDPSDQLLCARSLLDYADQLPTLTEAISSSQSALLPLPYEPTLPPQTMDSLDDSPPDTQGWVKATRPIWISPDLQIPKHTVGKIISGIDQKPVVVCWRFTWSAWRYWGRLLLQYAGYSVPQSNHDHHSDVFGSSSTNNLSWYEDKLETESIINILKMLTSVVECSTELGAELIGKMVGHISHQGLIQALFNLIEHPIDMSTHTVSSETTRISLRLVSALSPIFPGAVWTLVRGSHLLFPDSSRTSTWNAVETSGPTLKFERLSGEYGITLAILDLAQMLLMEAISSGLTTNPTFAEIKAEVLVGALGWICEEVWPGFQNWKYRRLEDKFLIASKCCTVFNTIASEALKTQLFAPKIQTDLVIARLAQSFFSWFLTSATAITLNPLVSIITTDKSVMETLRKFHRNLELEAYVESLSACTRLARNILALKINHFPAGQPSLLERLFMAQTKRKTSSFASNKDLSRQSVLPFIAQWCLDAPHVDISRDACDIFCFLCFLSQDWPSDWPSISSSFGDPDTMSLFLHELALQGFQIRDDDGLLRSSFWNLLAVLLDTQPSLGPIIVTGITSLPGSTSQSVRTLQSKSPFELGIATFVTCFENNNKLDIIVGQSVLYFLYNVYSQTNGFVSILSQTLENQEFVDRIIDISTSLINTPQSLLSTSDSRLTPMPDDTAEHDLLGELEELQVKHFCNELMCKAYATRTLTVLLQLESDQSAVSKGMPSKSNIGLSIAKELQKTPTQLCELICSAIESLANPELQSEALREINNRYPNLELDTYRRVDPALPYEKLQLYGKGFVYDYELMKGRVRGSDVSAKVADEVMKNLTAINWNLSAVDAQLEVTQSWESFLEVVFQQKNLILQLGQQLSQSVLESANVIAKENRGGDFMVNIHSVRISILLTLLQALPVNEETSKTTIKLLESVKSLISSERFPILDSIKRRLSINWHTNFLKLLYLIFKRCAPIKITSLNDEQRHLMINLVETFLRSSISILETVLTLAMISSDTNYEQDLKLSVSIFTELMNSPVRPPIMNWAHRIHDLCQPAFNLLTQEPLLDDQEPMFAEHVIRLFMSLALDDRLAEYMASEGLIPVLLNISLTQRASEGLIEPVSSSRPFERSPTHRLWCSILALVTSLANTLCYSETFMLDEIGSFARLYSPQLLKAISVISPPDHTLRGSYEMNLTLAGIEEAELVTDLLTVVSSKPVGRPLLSLPENYRQAMLTALQTLAHCLNHPNSTSKWLENDVTWKSGSRLMSQTLGKTDQIVVDNGQPLASHVQEALLHMLQVSRNILHTLVSHTRALNVLTRDVAEWATEYAVINPTRSIVVGDTATIGTLFELAETSLDIYRSACTRPSAPTNPSANLSEQPPVNVCNASAAVLELSLLLASSQLALWLFSTVNSESNAIASHKYPSSNAAHKDSDMSGQPQAPSSPRLKREILSDLAPDLMSSIEKGLSVIKLINSRSSNTQPLKNSGMNALNRSIIRKKTGKKPFQLASSSSSSTLQLSPANPHPESRTDLVVSNLPDHHQQTEDLLSVLKRFAERHFVE
ncbi:hypothetical protein PGT21_031609 [Puccinia graminis f. sp. tritici]|uniref:Nucleoporin Nup188 N-terminal subdomain III domain-containing protein n=1 Tax=Puccinia graminis f. sp. tritici TaxID=56615 RepID=A0A5B0PMQ6_PUCGR|nr:hypothetical protein PGT21_031609 [Puccinia graminis f. sp. tritici]